MASQTHNPWLNSSKLGVLYGDAWSFDVHKAYGPDNTTKSSERSGLYHYTTSDMNYLEDPYNQVKYH